MSISENVGALSNYLARVISGRLYSQLREGGKKALQQMPTMRALARRSEEHVKGMVLRARCSRRWGSITSADRRPRPEVAATRAAQHPRPVRAAAAARGDAQGQGYAPAEADPITWHGPGPFDPISGTIHKEKPGTPTYSQVFGQWLCDMADRDPRIVGITPAMREGSGLVEFSRRFPSAISMSPSPSSTPPPLPPDLPARHEAGAGDLLVVPAARLRSTDSRYRTAEAAGGVRARPRRGGRQRRRHPPRQL